MATPQTSIRIDPVLKKKSRAVLDEMGLSLSAAVTLFLKAIVREGCIPFEIKTTSIEKEN